MALRSSNGHKRRVSESDSESSPPRKKRIVTKASISGQKSGKDDSNTTTPKRRRRRAVFTRKRPAKVDSTTLWTVNDILCESVRDGTPWLLVVWSGSNPATNQPWDHNYEPIESIGEELLKGWALKKVAISEAKGVKAREKAARRTIHSYLADIGVDSIEYQAQLVSGQLNTSLLAQESSWFTSADYPSPGVKRHHRRTISSSSISDSSSDTSSPRSKAESANEKPLAPTNGQRTASQIETAVQLKSSARNQDLELLLPPPPSQPEAYQLVTESQLQISPTSGTRDEEFESQSDAETSTQTPASSIQEEARQFVPDSQSLLVGSPETQVESASSVSTSETGKENHSSAISQAHRASGGQTPAITSSDRTRTVPESVSDHRHSISFVLQESDSHTRVPDPPGRRANSNQNSLGFTQLDDPSSASTQDTYSLSLQNQKEFRSKVKSFHLNDSSIVHSALAEPHPSTTALKTEREPEVRSLAGAPIVSTELHQASKPSGNSTQDTTIGEFASQIPYLYSQVPSEARSSKPTDFKANAILQNQDNSSGLEKGQHKDRKDRSTSNSTFLETSSQIPQDTFTPLPQAPSQTLVDVVDSLSATRPVTPLGQTGDTSSREMSPPTNESALERFKRRRREIWGPSSRDRTSPAESNSVPSAAQTTQGPSASQSASHTAKRQKESLRDIKPQLTLRHDEDLEFSLSLSWENPARDLYGSILRVNKKLLDDLQDGSATVQDPDVGSNLAKAIDQMLNVCSHIDLVDNEIFPDSQLPMTDATQADWTVTVSSKCLFLKGFLLGASEVEKHVAIYTKSIKFMDILESFLRGIGISVSRPENNTSFQSAHGNIRATLVRTGSEGIVNRADLVIGLDEAFNPQDEQIKQVRRDYKSNNLCPSICLVVHHSIEHIWRDARLAKTGSALADELFGPNLALSARSHNAEAGSRKQDGQSPDELGAEIATLFVSVPPHQWQLPSVFDIDLSPEGGGIPAALHAHEAPLVAATRKRSIDGIVDDDGASPAKRLRQSSSNVADRDESTAERENEVEMTGSSGAVTTEEPGIEVVASAEILRAELAAKESLLKDLELELGKLQTRFEEQSSQNRILQEGLAKEQSSLLAATTRLNKLSTTNADLRSERTALQGEITFLRQALNGSGDEATRRLGELGEKAARVEGLEKRQESSKKELEFVRQNYQEASAAAKEHADDAGELRRENEELRRKASDQATTLRAMFTDATSKAYQDELKLRNAEKVHSDRALNVAQEEVRRLTRRLEQEERRAGMSISTRSSSLPVQEPGPAALAAARIFHGSHGPRNLVPTTRGGDVRGTVSANASRAASPSASQPARATFRTSPLQKIVKSPERE